MKHIKIITINTWKCDGEYHKRMQILAEQLKELKPDIVACQECFYCPEGNADTLKFLADSLGLNYSFLPGRFKKRLFEGEFLNSFSGLGILSKYPFGIVNQFELPEVPGDDDRKIQQAEIVLPDGTKLLLTNTHLTHVRDAVPFRKAQAETLADRVTGKNYRYNLICGDFNALPDSEEITAFKSKAAAIDCYTAGNGTEPRYSMADAFEAGKLLCIDHIFALPLRGENNYPQFENSAIVLNRVDEATGFFASDHFGIGTTLVTG